MDLICIPCGPGSPLSPLSPLDPVAPPVTYTLVTCPQSESSIVVCSFLLVELLVSGAIPLAPMREIRRDEWNLSIKVSASGA